MIVPQNTVVVPSRRYAEGEFVRIDADFGFWGGFSAESGCVVQRSHPDCGLRLTGKAVFLPPLKGSSSAGGVLLEAIRRGTAPSIFVVRRLEQVLVCAAVASELLYGDGPVVVLTASEAAAWDKVAAVAFSPATGLSLTVQTT